METIVENYLTGNLLVTGSRDWSIGLWDVTPLNSGKCPRLIHTLINHKARVTNVCIAPDDRTIISGSLDETMRLWDVDNQECLKERPIPAPNDGVDITVQPV